MLSKHANRISLAAIALTYFAVTVGESLLSPLLPFAAPDLGLDASEKGLILGLVAAGAAIGNLVGGFILGRFGPKASSIVGVGLSTIGSSLASVPGGFTLFAAAHGLIGFGAGVFFVGGIYSIGTLVRKDRRGRAMGLFGIAFSMAMAMAAGLAAVVGPEAWRKAFAVGAALGAISLILLVFSDLPMPPSRLNTVTPGFGPLLVPVAIGGVAAVAQFGLVAFVPTFAVEGWSMTATTGALILVVGRVLSIPGKGMVGFLVDRIGAIPAARWVGLELFGTGIVWLGAPWPVVGAIGAVAFAAGASALFPVANVVAVDRFSDRAGALGVFRSLQMLIAAIAAWLVGQGASVVGLRTALLVGVGSLLVILLVRADD